MPLLWTGSLSAASSTAWPPYLSLLVFTTLLRFVICLIISLRKYFVRLVVGSHLEMMEWSLISLLKMKKMIMNGKTLRIGSWKLQMKVTVSDRESFPLLKCPAPVILIITTTWAPNNQPHWTTSLSTPWTTTLYLHTIMPIGSMAVSVKVAKVSLCCHHHSIK